MSSGLTDLLLVDSLGGFQNVGSSGDPSTAELFLGFCRMPCGNTLLQDPEFSDRQNRSRLGVVWGIFKRDTRGHDGVVPGQPSNMSCTPQDGMRRVLNFQRYCASGRDGQLRPASIKSSLCYGELIRRDGASHQASELPGLATRHSGDAGAHAWSL